MRRGALLKVAQNIGMSPTSVGGGESASGNCDANAGFCGPGIVVLAGLPRALIAPCGGWSGLPNVCALAAAAADTTVPTVAAASTSRRDTDSMRRLLCTGWGRQDTISARSPDGVKVHRFNRRVVSFRGLTPYGAERFRENRGNPQENPHERLAPLASADAAGEPDRRRRGLPRSPGQQGIC